MSVDEKTIERLAELFHYYHGALAPDFGCGAARNLEWHDLTANERRRFVAAVRLALLEIDCDQSDVFGWQSTGTEGRECGS